MQLPSFATEPDMTVQEFWTTYFKDNEFPCRVRRLLNHWQIQNEPNNIYPRLILERMIETCLVVVTGLGDVFCHPGLDLDVCVGSGERDRMVGGFCRAVTVKLYGQDVDRDFRFEFNEDHGCWYEVPVHAA